MFRRSTVRYGTTPEPETPYQRASQAWDDRIGSARVQARSWRLAAFGSLGLSVVLAGGMIWQASRGTITPWVVQVDKLGEAQAVAAGDTVRWIIGDTVSGAGASARVHILVKPTRPGLVTNLVINTDKRTYHLELRSTANTYMASISWTYPQDALIAITARAREAANVTPVVTGVDLDTLNFRYRIDGDRTAWRPSRAFDDGRQVFIEFPASVAQSDMPPLFIIGAKGEGELVNYRVRGRFLVVDRLFDAAELRLGAGKTEKRVRMVREKSK